MNVKYKTCIFATMRPFQKSTSSF